MDEHGRAATPDPTTAAPVDRPPPTTTTTTRPPPRTIFCAVGDVHGQFSKVLQLIKRWELANGGPGTVSFVLQVGDMEPHRDEDDLASMAAPSKHRQLGDFHRVVSGELVFPWPLYFIGGNHEPWAWLDAHGGEGFALGPPNIHFLGRATVTNIGPLRVAALSGINGTNTLHAHRPSATHHFQTVKNKKFVYFTQAELDSVVHLSLIHI